MDNLNITSTPWALSSDEIFVYGTKNDHIVCGRPFDSGDQERFAPNAKAIVSAVNGTYGNGINPEAVKEMYECLLSIVNSYYSKNLPPDLVSAGEAVIAKAKL